MNSRFAPYIISLIAFAGFIIRAIYWLPLMPDKIAIHYGFNGTADNWGNKMEFIILMGGLMLFLGMLFFGLSALMTRLPDTMINLPNKEYWLAPERRETSLNTVAQLMKDIGSRTLLFFAVIFEITCRSNASLSLQIDTQLFFIVFGMYLFAVIVSIVYFVKQFSKPEHTTLNT